MKVFRIIAYVLILSSLFFAPLQRIKIADLEPVQAVWMYRDNDDVVLETDTEDKGSGSTVEEALADMKQNSSGIIYLDTAQYLFVAQSTENEIPSLQPHVKETVRLCQWEGQGDINEAIKYADAHKQGLKIRKWNRGSKLPELPPVKQEK